MAPCAHFKKLVVKFFDITCLLDVPVHGPLTVFYCIDYILEYWLVISF